MSMADKLGNQKPKSKQSKQSERNSDNLKAHQQYEAVGNALAVSGDARLGSLVASVVEQRKSSVAQFADVLEAAETGELDLMLLASELENRRQKRQSEPVEFKIESSFDPGIDLDSTIDCAGLITGFSGAKAIAGI